MSSATFEQSPPATQRSRLKRFFLSAPMRIIAGVLVLGMTAFLTFAVVKAVTPSPAARFMWPYLLAMALVVMAYRGFIRLTERRPIVELFLRGAGQEFGIGVAIGAAAVAATVGLLAASGSYRIASFNPWSATVYGPLAEMLFVGVMEEIVFRALLFRITEKALGTVAALIISAVLFSLAHLGGEISLIGLVNTALAGLMLSGAWMVTRRLWLCIGIHAAWNYVLGSVFSIAVSGHPAKGWIVGVLSGPDWVTGGAYGLEQSVWTTLVMTIVFVLLLRRASRTGQVLKRPLKPALH